MPFIHPSQDPKQHLDDYEDYMLALSRLEEKGPNISLEDAVKELGLSSFEG